jgi:SulP family sulfate permease
MISSSTGAMALLMVTLVKDHGLQYLLAATVLTGVIQLIAGYLKLGSLMRYVSRSVVTGFVNALAILIFMAQLPELTNVTWHVYAMTAAGLGIIYLFPYLNKTIPSPLVCIVVLTGISMWLHLDVRTVGDMGKLPDSLPVFLLPDVPLNFDTLSIILPYSAGLAVVGLLESMMTATIVDDMTDTPSDKTGSVRLRGCQHWRCIYWRYGRMRDDRPVGDQREIRGRGRLSALSAGVVLLCMVVFLRDWVSQIPMAALVAVMIMVSIGTFSWRSITNLRSHPLSTSVVMLATVVVVVATHNLAYGVLTGVLIASLNFASKVSRFMAVSSELKASTRTYAVTGQVFLPLPIGL